MKKKKKNFDSLCYFCYKNPKQVFLAKVPQKVKILKNEKKFHFFKIQKYTFFIQ